MILIIRTTIINVMPARDLEELTFIIFEEQACFYQLNLRIITYCITHSETNIRINVRT